MTVLPLRAAAFAPDPAQCLAAFEAELDERTGTLSELVPKSVEGDDLEAGMVNRELGYIWSYIMGPDAVADARVYFADQVAWMPEDQRDRIATKIYRTAALISAHARYQRFLAE